MKLADVRRPSPWFGDPREPFFAIAGAPQEMVGGSVGLTPPHLQLLRDDRATATRDTGIGAAVDEVLVERVLGGDRDAASSIYVRHAPAVRAVIARVLGVGPDLDDVLQDSFATAFRRVSTLRDRSSLRAWLRSVAVGVVRHHLRSRARRSWLSFFAPQDLPDTIASSAMNVDDNAAVRASYDVLRTLPIDERIAFALRHLEGLSLEESAAAAGVSLATFKRRLQRADQRFAAGARAYPALDAYASDPQRKQS